MCTDPDGPLLVLKERKNPGGGQVASGGSFDPDAIAQANNSLALGTNPKVAFVVNQQRVEVAAVLDEFHFDQLVPVDLRETRSVVRHPESFCGFLISERSNLDAAGFRRLLSD